MANHADPLVFPDTSALIMGFTAEVVANIFNSLPGSSKERPGRGKGV